MSLSANLRTVVPPLTAVLLLGAPSLAQSAVVWSDSGELSYGGVSETLPYLPTGSYVFQWRSAAPLTEAPFSSTFEDFYYYVYNFYFPDGTNYGGDEDLASQYFDLSPRAGDDPRNYSVAFKIAPLPAAYNLYYSPGGQISESDFYYGVGAAINLNPAQDYGAFSASISAVPEAPTWTLMLGGFGLLGIAGAAKAKHRHSPLQAL